MHLVHVGTLSWAKIHRGYSNYLLNMVFISSSEVENIHNFHFTIEIKDIVNKNI